MRSIILIIKLPITNICTYYITWNSIILYLFNSLIWIKFFIWPSARKNFKFSWSQHIWIKATWSTQQKTLYISSQIPTVKYINIPHSSTLSLVYHVRVIRKSKFLCSIFVCTTLIIAQSISLSPYTQWYLIPCTYVSENTRISCFKGKIWAQTGTFRGRLYWILYKIR